MARKTRLEKMRAENRKLREENGNLKNKLQSLEEKEEFNENQCEKNEHEYGNNENGRILAFLYEIIVPALVSICVYGMQDAQFSMVDLWLVCLISMVFLRALFGAESCSICDSIKNVFLAAKDLRNSFISTFAGMIIYKMYVKVGINILTDTINMASIILITIIIATLIVVVIDSVVRAYKKKEDGMQK